MPEEYKMKHKKFTRLGAFILVLCIFMGLVPGALAAGEQSGAVKIGLINLKGYASKDSSGSIVGVNAEYAYRIAQKAGFDLTITLYDNDPEMTEDLDAGKVDTSKVHVFATTPTYYDYNWTVRGSLDPQLAAKIKQAFLALDPANPEHKAILDLQAASRFIATQPENYAGIEEAARAAGLLK